MTPWTRWSPPLASSATGPADVARDDEVKAQAKRATASLNDALSATVNLIGDEVGGLFGRAKRGDPEVPPAEAPPSGSDDVRQ